MAHDLTYIRLSFTKPFALYFAICCSVGALAEGSNDASADKKEIHSSTQGTKQATKSAAHKGPYVVFDGLSGDRVASSTDITPRSVLTVSVVKPNSFRNKYEITFETVDLHKQTVPSELEPLLRIGAKPTPENFAALTGNMTERRQTGSLPAPKRTHFLDANGQEIKDEQGGKEIREAYAVLYTKTYDLWAFNGGIQALQGLYPYVSDYRDLDRFVYGAIVAGESNATIRTASVPRLLELKAHFDYMVQRYKLYIDKARVLDQVQSTTEQFKDYKDFMEGFTKGFHRKTIRLPHFDGEEDYDEASLRKLEAIAIDLPREPDAAAAQTTDINTIYNEAYNNWEATVKDHPNITVKFQLTDDENKPSGSALSENLSVFVKRVDDYQKDTAPMLAAAKEKLTAVRGVLTAAAPFYTRMLDSAKYPTVFTTTASHVPGDVLTVHLLRTPIDLPSAPVAPNTQETPKTASGLPVSTQRFLTNSVTTHAYGTRPASLLSRSFSEPTDLKLRMVVQAAGKDKDTKTDTDEDASANASKAEGPPAKETQVDVIVKRPVLDFSTGFAYTTLDEKNYTTFQTQTLSGTHTVVREGAKDIDFHPAVFGHWYITRREAFSFGPTIGITVPTDSKPIRYLIGGSLIFGNYNRLVFSGGLAFGGVTTLNGDQVGQPPQGTDIKTKSVMKQGYFLSFSYSLRF